MSYTIDMYWRKIKVQRNFVNFLSYVSLFPQLVAGPIVRYEDVQNEIEKRNVNINLVGEGVTIFIKGLTKKILLANNIGSLWTSVKALDYDSISVTTAWLGILAFTFQIYFDFSGYSDMAVGLGKMLGFNFPQNFDHPYMSKSISEFWRRWHITLGAWFREYIYIPLGGNRKGKFRTLVNTMIVWSTTGFWHGASWNFIFWGAYFGVLIIIERIGFGKVLDKKFNPILSTAYTFILVVIGWVFFDIDGFGNALSYLKAMFGAGGSFIDSYAKYQLGSYFIMFVFCIIASTDLTSETMNYIKKNPKIEKIRSALSPVVLAVLMLVSTAYLVDATYNPFLYFRF
jgi:alginate O-acetyltransferase complex protein AlgI